MSQFSENKRPGRLPEDESRSPGPDLTVDEKPFRLAKSFSMAAIVLIFASVLTLAAVVSRQAEIIITKRVEDDTIKLMTNLNLQMYIGFLKPATEDYDGVRLGDEEQREWLNGVIQTTSFGFDLKKVSIYNDKYKMVFTTEDSELPRDADDEAALREAVTRYTSKARLRIIPPEIPRPAPDDVESPPDPDGQPDQGDSPTGRPGDQAAQPPLSGGRYEIRPYLYFRVNPFNWEHRGGSETDGPQNEEQTDEGGRDRPPTPESVEGDDGLNERPSEDTAPETVSDDARYQIVTIGAYRYRQTYEDVDKDSPAFAQTIVGDDDFFLEYQRSQTVFRHEGGQYLLFNFFPSGEFMLKVYKVMESYEARTGPGVSGVLEITRDLTPEYKQIARLQYFALGVAIFLSLVLTVALRWVVSRGEAILNKRNLERQALRERLDQSERLAGLGSMVATVAHEIRNPLGIIHSTADVLNRFLSKDPDQARLAKAIVEEADRLSTVVTEFLDFARPPQPMPAPIVVEEILEEILAFLEITLVRAGVEIRCDFRKIQTPVMGDGPMLHRAFLNIIMNAIQAMDDGGLITVATRLEQKDGDDWLAVRISDTGPGLTEEAAKKMFSPFYTTKAKGTGLGLVIVRNIIEGHGGEIELISRPHSKKDDDAGLTVIIRLATQLARG